MGLLLRAVTAWLALGFLAGCENEARQPVFQEGPKGFVEFYVPAPVPGDEATSLDAQVFRVEQGQRIFLGMTRKWQGLSETRRGLTVTLPPGRQDFVIVAGGAEAGSTLIVKDGGYHRVRIGFTGLAHRQMIGTSGQVQFRIQATVESQL